MFLFIALTSLLVPAAIIFMVVKLARENGSTLSRDLENGVRNVRDEFSKLSGEYEEPDWPCTHCGRKNAAEITECDGCGSPVN